MDTEENEPQGTASVGSAGDPTPPTLADTDFVGRAMAKLAEQAAAPTAAPEPVQAPEQTQAAEEQEATPSAARLAAAHIASGRPAPTQEEPKEPALDGNMSGLAAIVGLEQAARQRQADLDARAKELEQQQQQVANLLRARQVLDAGGSKLEALQAMGDDWTYEALTEEVLGGKGSAGPATRELEELRAEMARLREELPKQYEQQLREAEEKRHAAEESAWKQQHAGILARDRGQPEDQQRWGLLTDPAITQGKDPVELVLQVMQRDFEARGGQGAILPFADAADILESEYEKTVRESAHQRSKLARILGLTSTLTATPETSASTVAGDLAHAAPGQTLSPDLASRAPASPPQNGTMSTADFVRRATEVAQHSLGTKGT